jgi:hypothetical protein
MKRFSLRTELEYWALFIWGLVLLELGSPLIARFPLI